MNITDAYNFEEARMIKYLIALICVVMLCGCSSTENSPIQYEWSYMKGYAKGLEDGRKYIEPSVLLPQYTLNHIPTYPDYIELDKDLVIEYDNPNPWIYGMSMTWPKGTKIYYREEANDD